MKIYVMEFYDFGKVYMQYENVAPLIQWYNGKNLIRP